MSEEPPAAVDDDLLPAEPIDLPAAVVDDEDILAATPGPWGRRLIIAMATVIGLAVVTNSLDNAAQAQLDVLEEDIVACDLSATLGTASTVCRFNPGTLVRHWPWTRDALDGLEREYARTEASGQLRHHARVALDRHNRYEAARRVSALWISELDAGPTQAIPAPYLFTQLREHGAFEALIETASEVCPSLPDDSNAASLAMFVGRIESATTLWSVPPCLHESPESALARVAWLCLDNADAGRLAAVELREHTTLPGPASERLALIEALCADRPHPPKFSEHSPLLQGWLAARELAHGRMDASDWLDAQRAQVGTLPVIAQTLLAKRASREQLLRWLTRSEHDEGLAMLAPDPAVARSGKGLLGLHAWGGRYSPEDLLAASEALATLAEDPSELSGTALDHEVPPAAWAAPREVLRHGAGLMAFSAAHEWLTRGELERAQKAAVRGRELVAPSWRWLAIGLAALAGDGDRARAWIRQSEPGSVPAATELRALVQPSANTLEHAASRWQDALDLAVRADERNRQNPDSVDSSLTAWHLALALRLNQPFTQDARMPPIPGLSSTALLQMLRWHDAPEVAAIERPWTHLDTALSSNAFPDLIGYAWTTHLEPDLDAETWLDLCFAGPALRRDRWAVWARAEIARWRDDQASAQLWRARAASVLALGTSEERVMLLRFAGY